MLSRINHSAEIVPAGDRRRPTMRVRVARLVACCAAAAVLWACGPVFIPVPPPSQTTFTLDTIVDSSGTTVDVWIAAGGPEPRAANGKFYIFDQARNAGVIAGAKADGSFQAPPMQGTAGDRILIHYADQNGNLSGTSCMLLSERRPTAALCP